MRATFVDDWGMQESREEWWWYNYTILFKEGRFYLSRYHDEKGIILNEDLGDFPDLNHAVLAGADDYYLRKYPALVEGYTR